MDVLVPWQLTVLSARRTRIVIPLLEDVFVTSTGPEQTVRPGVALAIQNVKAALDRLHQTVSIEMAKIRHVSPMQLITVEPVNVMPAGILLQTVVNGEVPVIPNADDAMQLNHPSATNVLIMLIGLKVKTGDIVSAKKIGIANLTAQYSTDKMCL